MLFNSYEFILLYLPITLILYYQLAKWLSNSAAKNFLIFASLCFYSYWDIGNLPILLTSISFIFRETFYEYLVWTLSVFLKSNYGKVSRSCIFAERTYYRCYVDSFFVYNYVFGVYACTEYC